MAYLQVHLLQHDFKNPVIGSSGLFGYGREYEELFPLSKLGGLSTKATTLHKRNGNDGIRITEAPSGVLFSVGLQNPGIDYYIHTELPNLLTKNTNILTNVAGSDIEEYVAIVEKLEETEAPIVELNISCPNVKLGGLALGATCEATERVTSTIRKRTKKPLTVKLTPHVGHIDEIAKAAEAAGADAISLINSMSGMKIDLRTRRPLFRNNTAGFSGEALFPVALRMVWQVARAVNIPVLGIGGVTSGENALEMMMAGASAIQVGSAVLRDPVAPERIIHEMNEWLDTNNVSDVNEIIGCVRPW